MKKIKLALSSIMVGAALLFSSTYFTETKPATPTTRMV